MRGLKLHWRKLLTLRASFIEFFSIFSYSGLEVSLSNNLMCESASIGVASVFTSIDLLQ